MPASWPVIDISASSTTCVRFDQHAVYLGTPGTDQHCPAGLVGGTEALLVRPATNGTTNGTTSATDDTVSRKITVTTPSASILAGYGTDRATIESVLASAGLPAPTPVTPRPSSVRAHTATTPLPVDATNYTGKAFDTCDAPSASKMATWKANSPYSAIGIYLGGMNDACPNQTYLDAAWLSVEYAAGWRFLPIYVGEQAFTSNNEITDPLGMATRDADEAVAEAQGLGLPASSVLYYDMESYATQFRGEVLAFEAAWVAEVHKQGYHAGIYGSRSSGITDLVSVYGGLATPDAAWSASWNNMADLTAADTGMPDADWSNHQKVHQYASPAGGETYGGVTISTDDDYVDVGIAGSPVPTVRSAYQTTTPTRLLDTRSGIGVPAGAVGAGQTVQLKLTGLPSSVTSVVLNVTAVSPTTGGYIDVFPDGVPRPNTSSLNFAAGVTIANLVTAPVYDGAVDFYNFSGSVQILADLAGYYTTTQPSEYHELAPTRLLDTRNGTGVPQGELGAGQTLDLTVGGVDGIPADVTAVIMNITAVNPSAGGYLTAYAGGTTRPVVSNLNFAAGQTIPNLAIVPVSNGVVSIYNYSGDVDVLGDVTGFFTSGTKYQFTPLDPVRLLDTRSGTGAAKAAIPPNGTVRLAIAGNAGVPADVEAVALNVTAIAPTSSGYLTVYPDGQARPNVSNLNFTAGETIANQVIVPVVDGYVDFYNLAGNTNVTADIAGYFTG